MKRFNQAILALFTFVLMPAVGHSLTFMSSGGAGSGSSVGSTTTFSGAVTVSTFQVVGGSMTFNATGGDFDAVFQADANGNGLYFDAGIISGQGGLGIGTVPTNKLDIQVNAGSAQGALMENQSTGGYATWTAKSNGTTETAQLGVGGSTTGDSYSDYGYLFANAGLSGWRFFTNGGTLATTIDNLQVQSWEAPMRPWPRTSAQIGALAGAEAGRIIYNSDLATVCVSTGAGVGAWVTMAGSACD